MGRLFAASIYVIVALLAMIFGVGMLVILKLQLPPGVAMAVAGTFAFVVVMIQYMVGPALIDWIIKTRWTYPRELGPEFDAWFNSTCRTFKIPTPRLGIIEEAAPNAFTYGHGPWDARVVITRGLIDVLEPDELQAVVAHELGHVRHRDFIVMTLVQALVLVLYSLYIASRSNNRGGAWVVVVSYLAYWASYYISLVLSRIREYMADHASAQIMQNGNSLATALVKIAYGLARTSAASNAPDGAPAPASGHGTYGAAPGQMAYAHAGMDKAAQLAAGFQKEAQAKQPKQKPSPQAFSASSLGAFGVAGSASMRAAVAWFGPDQNPDPDNFIVAARWELFNPWAKFAEFTSTHPLTALRIKALMKLNRIWSVPDRYDFSKILPAKYKYFLRDLLVLLTPWITAAAGVAIAVLSGKGLSPIVVILAGLIGMFLGNVMKIIATYPSGFTPNQTVRLLGEVQCSHLRPIPVAVEGVFTGRLSPGIAWASDFILQDDTAFIACLYRQPIGLLQAAWGYTKAARYVGRRVRVYGWYRRLSAPYLEISRVEVLDTRETLRSYYLPYLIVASLGLAALLSFLIPALSP